jgi:hypothetical protein
LHVVHRVIVLHVGIETKNHQSLSNQSRHRKERCAHVKNSS